MKNVLDELYGFVYTKGLQRKPRDKGRGFAPGPTEEAYVQGILQFI
jgi:hypothetical protein